VVVVLSIAPVAVIAGVGNANTFTVMEALGPSQLVMVWLTYQVLLPTVPVGGVGAVALPVPPVAAVYHNKLLPVAVSGALTASIQ